ncbi:MAG: phosphopantetheine adenylyltransferase [Pseudomonadota bacterium]
MTSGTLLATATLLAVGLLNAVPVVGIASADQLARLYGIEPPGGDLLILLRHRALLFGLLGGFLIASAFVPSWQGPAITLALLSMVGFVVFALLEGSYGAPLRKIVIADVVGTAALLALVGARLGVGVTLR